MNDADAMTPSAGFYSIEQIQTHVVLCFIHIPSFVAFFLPDVDVAAFRRQRQALIDHRGPLSRFFTEGDMKRVNGFKVLKKQVEWMAGKAAVKILAHSLGLGTESDSRIVAEPGGAPYLADHPAVSVSISHSGDYAAAAIGSAGHRVALDIERIEQGRMQNIVRVAFSDREIANLEGRSDEDHYLAWTAKEAFLKYIRRGFAEGLKKVEILNGTIIHHGRVVSDICTHSRIFDSNYALTLMHGKSGESFP